MKPEYAKGHGAPELDEVLADYMQRIDRGEPVDREALIQAHPDLVDELREYFSQASAIGFHAPHSDATAPFAGIITPKNTLPIRCPNCQELIKSETDVRPVDLVCSRCGKLVSADAAESVAPRHSGESNGESRTALGKLAATWLTGAWAGRLWQRVSLSGSPGSP